MLMLGALCPISIKFTCAPCCAQIHLQKSELPKDINTSNSTIFLKDMEERAITNKFLNVDTKTFSNLTPTEVSLQ